MVFFFPSVFLFFIGLLSCASIDTTRKSLYRAVAVETHQGRAQDTDGLAHRDFSLPIWPFMNESLPTGSLDRAFRLLADPETTSADHELAQLVRVLYLTEDKTIADGIVLGLQELYDSGDLKFWLTVGETHNCYWAEPDMILWLSSTWLLRSKLQVRPGDDAFTSLESRLVHFLETKKSYGFYEFFSQTYSQGTLAALLNLYDFSHESPIKMLAGNVITRLLGEFLLFPTEQGHFFAVTGRGSTRDFIRPRFSSIVWFLTQNEPIPIEPDFAGAFLATTSFDLENIGTNWEPSISKKLLIGHPVSQLQEIHQDQTRSDRILFQWSAGAFVYPEVVGDTFYLIDGYQLQNHVFWKDMNYEFLFSTLFRLNLSEFTNLLFGFTRGTNLSGANVTVYRNNNVVLSSLERYNVQYRSREQWVWVAGIGDIAVWTQAGVTGNDGFEDMEDNAVNSHMPLIQQQDNVALISYRPAKDIRENPLLRIFLPDLETKVALHFPMEQFDEVHESGRWLIGRNGDGYIGVWRHGLNKTTCVMESDSCMEYFYSDPADGLKAQVWAVVVGNSITHGDYDSFRNTVATGSVSEQSSGILSWLFGWGYRTELHVDGKTIVSEL